MSVSRAPSSSAGALWLGSECGLAYLGVLIVSAMLAISLSAAGIVWSVAQQREREQQLLFIGNQFRVAIGRYYLNQLGPQKEYPKRLEDLLRDPRHPGSVRYLRALYADPMTGTADWGLLKTPDGSLLGVYSKSPRRPIKNGRFRPANQHFERKAKYSEWKFAYLPGQPLGPSSASQSGGQNPLSATQLDLDSLVGQPAVPGKFGDLPPVDSGEPPQAEALYERR